MREVLFDLRAACVVANVESVRAVRARRLGICRRRWQTSRLDFKLGRSRFDAQITQERPGRRERFQRVATTHAARMINRTSPM